ncbi:TPA: hypothetical protein ACXRUV_005148 [Klebsiella quasipneumoniae subsp. similipneumoniae]
MYIILSDDYYFCFGLESYLARKKHSARSIHISDWGGIKNIQLDVAEDDIYILAIDDSFIRIKIQEMLAGLNGDLLSIYDIPVNSIKDGLFGYNVLSKKSSPEHFIKNLANSNSKINNISRLNAIDLRLLSLSTSGISATDASVRLGISVKTFYAKKKLMLSRHGILHTGAFGIMLLDSIISAELTFYKFQA